MYIVGFDVPLLLVIAAGAAITYCVLAIAFAIVEGVFGWEQPQWVQIGLIAVAVLALVCLVVFVITLAITTDYGAAQLSCPPNPTPHTYSC